MVPSFLTFRVKKCRELTSSILNRLLKDLDAILFDCDGEFFVPYLKKPFRLNAAAYLNIFDFLISIRCIGVLYKGENVIEGTPEVILKLQSMGKKTYYVTNNASKTRKEFMAKLAAMGFPVTEDVIINSGYAASCYLSEMKDKGSHNIGKIFCLGSESLMEELEMAGLSVLKKENPPAGKGGIEMATNYALNPEVECVLASLDEDLTYLKVSKAARYLSSPGCLFAATNTDGTLPVSNNIFLPDSGPLVAMLTATTGRKPEVVCGKPSKVMFEVAQKKFGVTSGRTLMVGDRLDTDIAFANECKLKSLLVLTGVSSIMEARRSRKNLQPDFFLGSLADLLKLLDA